jgi:hypothetical protein
MLTRYIYHRHIFRTNRLALLRLREFHDSQYPPPLPTLDWTPGEPSGSNPEDPETPPVPIRVHRSVRRAAAKSKSLEVDPNPTLDWYSGQRNSDFSTSRPSLLDIDVQEPRLNWLKKGWASDLSEDSDLSLLAEELGRQAEELKKKAAKLRRKEEGFIRKVRSQPGGTRGPKNPLVRRYELDPEPEIEPKEELVIRRLSNNPNKDKGRRKAPEEKEEKPEVLQEPLRDSSKPSEDPQKLLKDSNKPSEGPHQLEQKEAEFEELEAHQFRIRHEYLRSSKQEATLIRRVHDVSNPRKLRTAVTEEDLQALAVGQQGPPVIRKVLNAPSNIEGPPIRKISGQPSLPKIRIVLTRGFSSAAVEMEMEDGYLEDVTINQVEESTKEKLVNEAVPDDTNLIGGDNGQASPKDNAPETKYNTEANSMGENSSAASAQKPHDLKRANLGSYQKAPLDGTKKSKRRKVHAKEVKEGSNEVVLGYDIKALLSSLNIEESEDVELPERDAEIKLTVSKLSSTGEGLAVYNGRVYTVPFGVPGDQVTATVRRHNDDHSVSKITSIDQPSPDRDDSLVGCGYFGTCNGCQFQMLPYAVQLEHKRKVVQRAFKNFSNLSPELLPEIGATMPSPLQYGYRTKLTPHFNGPRRGGFKENTPVPNIGFFAKDPAYVMDIEDCPIGTNAVREGMTERRTFVKENLRTAFKRGATLLLRESTMRTYLEEAGEDGKKWVDKKLCITDHNARSIEYIEDLKFDNPAGSFFQNNNSILESVC